MGKRKALYFARSPGDRLRSMAIAAAARDVIASLPFILRLKSIEHPVDHDSGDGNVKPDRKGPARDASMRREFLCERPHQRDEREGHNSGRQNGVGEQNGEINRANPTLAFERHGTDLIVIDKIGNQKKARAHKGR